MGLRLKKFRLSDFLKAVSLIRLLCFLKIGGLFPLFIKIILSFGLKSIFNGVFGEFIILG